MAKFVDFDPERGLATYEDRTQDGRLQVHYRQDVEPLLDYTKELRNSGSADLGIKRDMWHYAHIPPIIMMKWKNELGVDLFNKNHLKRVLELLDRDYKMLKTTDKHHITSY